MTVNNIPTATNENVQSSSLSGSGVVGHKTGKEIVLSVKSLSDYEYLIGENSGTITNVVTKY